MTSLKNRLKSAPFFVLVIGLLSTGLIAAYLVRANRATDEVRMENAAQRVSQMIEERVGHYTSLLRAGAALFAFDQELTDEGMREFVGRLRLAADYPGIPGIGFARWVPGEEREEFIEMVRRTDPTFDIAPAGDRDEHFPILFFEPPNADSRSILGQDLFVEPILQEAMVRAMEEDSPLASRKVGTGDVDDEQRGVFFIFVPAYRGATPSRAAEKDFLGFVFSPLRAHDLLESVFRKEIAARVQFEVYDGEPVARNILYSSPVARGHEPAFSVTDQIESAGRQWTIVFGSTPSFEATTGRTWLPWITTAGLLFSFTLFGITWTLANTTDRARRSQREEAEQRERLRVTLASISDGFVFLDREWRFSYINPRAAAMLGTNPEDLLGRVVWEVLPPSPGSPIEKRLRQAAAEKVKVEFEHHSPELGGWFEIHAYPSADGLSVYFHEISERKRILEIREHRTRQITLRGEVGFALAQRETSLKDILGEWMEAMRRYLPGGVASIWIMDPETGGVAEKATSAGEDILPPGRREAEVIVASREPYVTNDLFQDPLVADRNWYRDRGLRALAGYPLLVGERLAGVLILFAPHPFTDDTLETLAAVADVIAQGIERRRAEDALSRHAENLERTVAERTARLRELVSELEAFSYSISHDMRAPLRAIHGMAQVLMEDHAKNIGPQGTDYLKRLISAAVRLDRLIQDVLAYSRLIRSDIRLCPIELDVIFEEIMLHYPEFNSPSVDVEIQKPLLNVMGQEASLTQCITNLLGNAVKFVPPETKAQVKIWTERRGDFARLYFKDNGIGIEERYHERIFKMFERIHPEKMYTGTGIGLAIVRKAVERMKGKVGLESAPGKGSTFWIELPAADEDPDAGEGRRAQAEGRIRRRSPVQFVRRTK